MSLIVYRTDAPITVDQFIDVLQRSTLAERRPIDDLACMEAMVTNANLTATAWDGARLVGVARSVTDFVYACYCSDLAVDVAYQRAGIGKALIDATLGRLGPRCTLRLVAAPAAAEYYAKIGFTPNHRSWEISRGHR